MVCLGFRLGPDTWALPGSPCRRERAQHPVQRWEVCVVVTVVSLQMAIECPEEGVPLLVPVLYWLTAGLPQALFRASGLTFPRFFRGLRILSTLSFRTETVFLCSGLSMWLRLEPSAAPLSHPLYISSLVNRSGSFLPSLRASSSSWTRNCTGLTTTWWR